MKSTTRRSTQSQKTIKLLFAKSGNQCAFPDCTHEIISRKNIVIGEIAHIESERFKGPRFNSKSQNTYRRSYENLILLCHAHHKEIDELVNEYTVKKLKSMKKKHEENQHSNLKISDEVLAKLEGEYFQYWEDIKYINQNEHICKNLARKIDTKSNIKGLYKKCLKSLNDLHITNTWINETLDSNWDNLIKFLNINGIKTTSIEKIPYYENPFYQQLWEIRMLRINNIMGELELNIRILVIRALEHSSLANPNNLEIKKYLSKLKQELLKQAGRVMYVD
jgi:hypothetical protein